MLRGVNVGSHNRIKMDALRGLYESLHLEEPRTYLQSGNVIFRAADKAAARVGERRLMHVTATHQRGLVTLDPGVEVGVSVMAASGPAGR